MNTSQFSTTRKRWLDLGMEYGTAKQFVYQDSIRYDGVVEGKDNGLGFNWRFNGIQQLKVYESNGS